MRVLARWRAVPAALLVIVAGILLDRAGWCQAWGVSPVGPIVTRARRAVAADARPGAWLRLGELAFAVALILYAESYGSIRTFALRHGDNVSINRDLLALGVANIGAGIAPGDAGGRRLFGDLGQRVCRRAAAARPARRRGWWCCSRC